MYLDGLEDAYDPGKLMGAFAEEAAQSYQFTRAAQDDYALECAAAAREAAIAGGAFDREITGVAVTTRKGTEHVTIDRRAARQGAARQDPDIEARVRQGRHDYRRQRLVDFGRRRGIGDDACQRRRRTRGLTPVARIVAHAGHAHEPGLFTTAPVPAIRKVLAKAGWTVADVDLFEVNEAFAAVAMIAMRDLGLDHAKVNVNGGATALGHPIGASGARIIATLVSALQTRGLKRGVAALCIGGGEATAVAVELV